MISKKKVVSYPAENRYKSAAFEDQVTISNGPSLLLDLYAFNNTNATVYLAVIDVAAASVNTALSNGSLYTVYPVTAGGYISISNDKGERFANGVAVWPFSDAACTSEAANSLKYNIGWNRYV